MATVNLAMEHSAHGDFEARVHVHVFIGPDVRSGVGLGWSPVLVDVNNKEVVWRGIPPNVKPSKPQKKSWTRSCQAVVAGSFYIAGPKIGSILKRSTFKPAEDSSDCSNQW